MTGVGVVIGLLTGTLVGASAIGSGSLVLSLLLLLTPIPAATAVGTCLALATGTKLVGYLTHRQMGHVNLGLGKWLIAGAVPGAIVAATVLLALRDAAISPVRTRQAVGVLLALMAVALLLAPLLIREAKSSGSVPTRGRALLIGAGVALVVGVTAIGSGGLLMLALLLWRQNSSASEGTERSHPELVGTTIFYGLAATLLGALAHLAVQNVDMSLLAQLAAGSVPGVLIGTRLTRLIPERFYQLGVAGLNLVLGLRLAWGA